MGRRNECRKLCLFSFVKSSPSPWSHRARVIVQLDEDEIAGMRKVCRLAREVLDVAGHMVKPGITTDEIDQAVHRACLERDSYPSPLNYYNFPKSVCTSVNEVSRF